MIRRIGKLAVSTIVAASAFAASAQASPGVQPCIGAPADNPAAAYNETRQFVDSQAWWMPGVGQTGDNFGHAHVGACIPEREQMSGTSFPLDIKLQLHDNPAKKTSTYPGLSIVVKGTSQETTIQKHNFPGWTCPEGTCVKWVRTTIPLSAFNNSGLQEMRFRFFVDEPDGNRMIANMNWQTFINNGKSQSNVTRQPYLRGKGWYTHSLYCESSYRSVPLPDAPVSTPFTPLLEQVTHSSDASLPVTHHSVRLDPDFHAVPSNPGTILEDEDGPMPAKMFSISADPGTHKLFQRADCRDDSAGFQSTNSGVLIVPYQVQ